MLTSASDKAKFFAKNFSKNSNINESGTFLLVFPYRTNIKLHSITVTPKMVRKFVTNLDSLNAYGPNCIQVVILKNCEPEFSYILAGLFNVSERILFSRLFEGLLSGPYIYECWGKGLQL